MTTTQLPLPHPSADPPRTQPGSPDRDGRARLFVPPDPPAAKGRRTPGAVLRSMYGPLVAARTWKESAALLLALPTGALWFTIAVSGVSVAAGLMLTLVGLPLLVAVLLAARAIGAAERAISTTLLAAELPPPAPLPRDGSVWRRARAALGDAAGWKAIGFSVLALPVGIATATVTVVLWSVAAAMATFPIWQLFVSDPTPEELPTALHGILDGWGRTGAVAGTAAFGLVVLALTPRILHRVAASRERLVRRLLSAAPR